MSVTPDAPPATTAKRGRGRQDATVLATVVVDTSALLSDPTLLDELSDRRVVVPLPVVVELDGHKRRSDDLGYAAREAIRRLDGFRFRGDLRTGVASGRGGDLRILEPTDMPVGLTKSLADHATVAVAWVLAGAGERVELLTDNASQRVVAGYHGVAARHHEPPVRDEPAHETGWVELTVADGVIDRVYDAARGNTPGAGLVDIAEQIPHPNGYALLQAGPSRAVRVRRRGDLVTPIGDELKYPCGIKPKDLGQTFALDALADNSIPLVALTGAAGSGKTLLAIATGLMKVHTGEADYVAVIRPITPVDRQDLGHLPGELDEKLAPWMGAVADVLSNMTLSVPGGRDGMKVMEQLVKAGKLQLMPVTHLRGRTLHRAYAVLDEAQNLSVRGVRTVATRIGAESKLVVVGDPHQIDDPYLTVTTNGMTRLLEGFAGQRLFTHIHLTGIQRSDLAAVAAELL